MDLIKQNFKNSINYKCWRGCEEKRILIHCWWECKLGQALWKTVWNILKSLKIELPYYPAILLLGCLCVCVCVCVCACTHMKKLYVYIYIYTHMKITKTLIGKHTCISLFIVTLFTIANPWKQLMLLLLMIGLRRCDIYIHTHIHTYMYAYTQHNITQP